jgi:SAM-dependent methyltransferase
MRRSNLLARQGRRPSGLLGHVIGRIMARETRAANLIALERLDLSAHDDVLEVGFGHGRTLAAAAEVVTEGRLAGVDPSEVMLQIARQRNATAWREGRMDLKLGVSDDLPWAADNFDKAFAVHIIYFWRRPARDLAEIHRVLRPGGRLVLGYRPSEDAGFARDFPAEIYAIRTIAEIERLVASVGFSGVATCSRTLGHSLMAWTMADKRQHAAHGKQTDKGEGGEDRRDAEAGFAFRDRGLPVLP